MMRPDSRKQKGGWRSRKQRAAKNGKLATPIILFKIACLTRTNSRGDRKRQAEQSQAIKAKKRNEHIAARSDAKKNKKLGLKPKGDKDKGASKGKSGGYKGKKPDQDKGKGKARPGF